MSPGSYSQALLDAHLELWHHTYAYLKSMAFKSSLDLGIPDSIQRHGGAATLPQIAIDAKVHQSRMLSLGRLMRLLTTTGVFGTQPSSDNNGEPLYTLTPVSRLLVGTQSLVPSFVLPLHPNAVTRFSELGKWFQSDPSDPCPCKFDLLQGQDFWDLASHHAAFNTLLDEGMASDTRFIMDVVIHEYRDIFEGITSLIDVAGGLGVSSQAISKAFPHVKCSVLDLDHVIAKAPTDTKVQYIAGDMFESIPPANVAFLKWVLHDWGNEDCVRILKNCKQAIPPRDGGGKVIIIDMVVGAGPADLKHKEMQDMYDLAMTVTCGGMERNEQEWKKIFFEAGFSDYKITPGLGARSIIEIYP